MDDPNLSKDRRHELESQTPAAKLVFLVLEQHGRPLPISEISQRTLLPDSTTRSALTDLRKNGLVERTTDTRDARKRLYKVQDAPSETAK